MNRKIIGLVCFIALLSFILLVYMWNQDDSMVKIVNDIKSNETYYGITLENTTGDFLHNIRYGSNRKIICNLISLDENGHCNQVIEIKNGYIQMVWRNEECINIVYQKGRDIYKNSSKQMWLFTYNIKENSVISDNIITNRIWGIDYVDNKPIYDSIDISLKSGLASNIYCDDLKRLYMDGNKLIEYNKNSQKEKEVFELKKSCYLEIGKLSNNTYALLCSNDLGKTSIYLLNADYSIATQKEIEVKFRCSSIGGNNIILIDDFNHVTVIGAEGDMKSANWLQLDEKESILDISYNLNKNEHIIITDKSLIIADFDNEKVVRKCKLSMNLHNLNELISLSN